MTDARGFFALSQPAELVRFSARGFRPLTKLRTELAAGIVMQPTDDPVRVLGRCQGDLAKDRRHPGVLRFRLPPGSRAQTSNDRDYQLFHVRYGVDWMEHGGGPHWSSGLPVPSTWKEWTMIQEKDIKPPEDVPMSDYSGRRADGSHFRFIGLFSETISYDKVSTAAAAYFDRILDTLCWASPS
jgi:hypothetical protein